MAFVFARFGFALALGAAVMSPGFARADELISVRSALSVADTIARLQKHVLAAGFFVAAHVDHAENAAKAGLTLRPTELLVFGNPKGGTPIMQCDQRAGIDLPLKALAWQDATGQVWLGMTDPGVLKTRWDLGPDCDKPIAAMQAAVRRLLDANQSP